MTIHPSSVNQLSFGTICREAGVKPKRLIFSKDIAKDHPELVDKLRSTNVIGRDWSLVLSRVAGVTFCPKDRTREVLTRFEKDRSLALRIQKVDPARGFLTRPLGVFMDNLQIGYVPSKVANIYRHCEIRHIATLDVGLLFEDAHSLAISIAMLLGCGPLPVKINLETVRRPAPQLDPF